MQHFLFPGPPAKAFIFQVKSDPRRRLGYSSSVLFTRVYITPHLDLQSRYSVIADICILISAKPGFTASTLSPKRLKSAESVSGCDDAALSETFQSKFRE